MISIKMEVDDFIILDFLFLIFSTSILKNFYRRMEEFILSLIFCYMG